MGGKGGGGSYVIGVKLGHRNGIPGPLMNLLPDETVLYTQKNVSIFMEVI